MKVSQFQWLWNWFHFHQKYSNIISGQFLLLNFSFIYIKVLSDSTSPLTSDVDCSPFDSGPIEMTRSATTLSPTTFQNFLKSIFYDITPPSLQHYLLGASIYLIIDTGFGLSGNGQIITCIWMHNQWYNRNYNLA